MNQLKGNKRVKIKRLALVNGDEYEDVHLITDIPEEVHSIVHGQFIGVKTKHYTVYLQKEFIASLQLDKDLKVISS